MKCKQNLCQRSKNINNNGNCNICDDAINEALKQFKSISKKTMEDVEVDLNLMIEVQNKLFKEVVIEPQVVCGLLLGGVTNIINQHDKIVDFENKSRLSVSESCTNKTRIKMLENWVQKQDDLIKEIDDKLSVFDKNGANAKDKKKNQSY